MSTARLAMRRPGTQFSGDGLSLSWPLGGEREVIEFSGVRTPRITQRIAQGQIVEVQDPITPKPDEETRTYRLLTGEEARAHKSEPPGPVTRFVYTRGGRVVGESHEAHESDRYLSGQEEAAAEAAEARAAGIKKQIAVERKVAELAAARDGVEVPSQPLPMDQRYGADQAIADADKVAHAHESRNAAATAQAERDAKSTKAAATRTEEEPQPKNRQTVVARDVKTIRQ